MNTPSLDEQKQTALLDYLSKVSDRLTSAMASADRFVNFAGIIVAATITAGLVAHPQRPLIAILAPYGLVIVFAYQVQLYTDAERLTVLLEHLEAQLNQGLGDDIFNTDKVMGQQYRNRCSVKGMQVLYVLIAAASFSLSAGEAYVTYGLGWLFADIAGLAMSVIPLGLAIRELRNARKSVLASLANPPTVAVSQQSKKSL